MKEEENKTLIPLKYHGIIYNTDNNTGAFHFAIIRLLWMFTFPNVIQRTGTSNIDKKFDQTVCKFQNCYWKFKRTAWHIDKCIEILKADHAFQQKENSGEFHCADTDISIYLEWMLFSFRTQADSIAEAIKYFYILCGEKKKIPGKFKEQKAYFLKKNFSFSFNSNSNLDPIYSEILRSESNWFEFLIEKGEKLRDTIVHNQSRLQIVTGSPPQNPKKINLDALLICKGNFEYDDVIEILKETVRSYYSYLDKTFLHFSNKLGIQNIANQFYTFESLCPSFWIFPTINS